MFSALCDIIESVKKFNSNFYVEELSIVNSFGGEGMVKMSIEMMGGYLKSYTYRTNADTYVIMQGSYVMAKGNPHNYDDIEHQLKQLFQIPEDIDDIDDMGNYAQITKAHKVSCIGTDDVMKLKPIYDLLDKLGNKFFIVYDEISQQISIAINTLNDEYANVKRAAVIFYPSYEMRLIDINDKEENIECCTQEDFLDVLKTHVVKAFSKVNVIKHEAILNDIRDF